MANRFQKTVETQTKHLTKAEKETKLQAQERIKSNALKLRINKLKTPSKFLINESMNSVWKFIVKELLENKDSMATNLDIFTLENLCDSIYLYRDAINHLKTEPQVSQSENRNGQIYEITSPWVAIRDKQMQAIRNSLKDLGISMDARIKMAMLMNNAEKDEENNEINGKMGVEI